MTSKTTGPEEAAALQPTRRKANFRRVTTVKGLIDSGLATSDASDQLDDLCQTFSLGISGEMVELIKDAQSPIDPIALQFIPSVKESDTLPIELADPIGDEPYTTVPGITHRYPDRVLLKPLHSCAVYCRFCFRREKVGQGGDRLSEADLEEALSYIRNHNQIWEVILTGGDPLVLSPRRLGAIVKALEAIPHVEVVRIHTRVPSVEPSRITSELVNALRTSKALYVVLHCNHAREMTEAAVRACAQLVNNGIPMLSQSVLLRGVNDDPQTIEQLMRALVKARVKPYYLHHGDLAKGTAHFRTSIQEGQALVRALRGRVSGLCQPTYVLDIPGGHGKVPVGPSYLEHTQPSFGVDSYTVTDYRGNVHIYPPAAG